MATTMYRIFFYEQEVSPASPPEVHHGGCLGPFRSLPYTRKVVEQALEMGESAHILDTEGRVIERYDNLKK